MKESLKEFGRLILAFWYPAIVACWGAEAYVHGLDESNVLKVILGPLLMLCAFILAYEEAKKLRKKEEEEEDKDGI